MLDKNNLFTGMIIRKTNTGNEILDYLISIILISIITFIYQNNLRLRNYIIYYINYFFYSNNYSEIIIDAQTILYDRNGMKTNKLLYSKIFQAITFYIKKIKPDNVFSKREADKSDKDSNPMFDIFIPDQDKSFILDKDKNIECIMRLIEDSNINNDKNEPKKNHIIKVFSKNKNIKIYDLENFIEGCLKEYNNYLNSKTNKNQYYFSFIDSENNGSIINYSERLFNSTRTFDTIFFEDKDKFLYNLNFFLNGKEWYLKKGIPYHFGILLHGFPGCGKTSLIKAILTHTKRHAFVIPLNRIKTCGELENIFYEPEINGREISMNDRIYIFEDIDCLTDIVNDRLSKDIKNDININNEFELIYKLNDNFKKTVDPDDKLNLSCLLNIFDGILEIPGRIIILTSNYPDRIDKALLRPGRIDINIELKKASNKIIKDILKSFYDINDINDINIDENRELFENIPEYILTHAEIINICQKNIDNLNNAIKDIIDISKKND